MSEQEFYPRDSRQAGHFWADNEVLDLYAPQLGAHGFAVYMALTRYAINGTGECRMSTRKLADRLNMSVGGVFNALNLIVDLGLAFKQDAGDRRSCAVYILGDVKGLTNPEYAQLRLSGKGVHPVNTERNGVHAMNTSVRPVNEGVHPVNSEFIPRTRNKERKTFTRLNTKSKANLENPCVGAANKCALHPGARLNQSGKCWECYSTKHPSGCLPA